MATMVSVTIGRNVKNEPMSSVQWLVFIEHVEDALSVATAQNKTLHRATYTGAGEWDGSTEESANIVLILESARINTGWLTDRLAVLSARYGQDAIALAVGESTLIERY